jgi:cytochrome bd-type quinol oxidase subunit 2
LTNEKIMLIMKTVKKLSVFISGLLAYLSLPIIALADTVDPCAVDSTGKVTATGIAGTLCSLGGANVGATIRNIVIFLIIIAVVVALMYLLYGGIKWITSKGEKTEVEAARNHIMAAIMGLIVVFLAIFILSIVLAAFGINFNQLTIPNIGTTTP